MKKRSKVTAIFPAEYALEVRQAIRMVVPEKELELRQDDPDPPPAAPNKGRPPVPPLSTASFNGT